MCITFQVPWIVIYLEHLLGFDLSHKLKKKRVQIVLKKNAQELVCLSITFRSLNKITDFYVKA